MEDEMVGWHHRLNRHEFEQALGNGEGQGSLACYIPRSRKEMVLLLTGKTLASLTFSEIQRAEHLLIKAGAGT